MSTPQQFLAVSMRSEGHNENLQWIIVHWREARESTPHTNCT